MLKLKEIKKDYVTGDSTVHALRGVSLEFRKSEFVSILGQSGCGKTTLLNIIGGLDKYTSGDLIINGVSTKQYKDSDWDTYRNHSIGFVFQSYNLIPHQSVLANVELALTLCGVSKAERKKRAIEALEKVGLGDQIHKKPNQMSGGQMQRVAIARALVNNPDILLADEPTGALDSETSVQIMEILKEISKDKLIIMVTHNPDLANTYSTRIINLLDGMVISDSDPYTNAGTELCEVEVLNATLEPNGDTLSAKEIKKTKRVKVKKKAKQNGGDKKKKRSMSFLTALSLSLNNLLTKKGRTFLTAFAGSIGIIGIALILSVSSGVNSYIDSVENSTMSSYPLTINQSSMDTMTLLESLMSTEEGKEFSKDKVYSNDIMIKVMTSISNGFTENNLKAFKDYIENDPDSKIKENSTDIKYSYQANLNTYTVKTLTDENGNTTISYVKNLKGLDELLGQIGLSSFANDNMQMVGGNAWSELVGDME
ncbi:MAG: ABC transporter ATP-binding protein, partial [Clostridia bacterium]|nr:ABC transporter ATP-binding protein [Clostridia bacterium]